MPRGALNVRQCPVSRQAGRRPPGPAGRLRDLLMRVGNAVLHVTRPARRAAALAGLAALAVTAAGLAAPGAASAASGQPAAPAAAVAAADSPGTVPAAGVSSSARFAAAPHDVHAGARVRQACATQTRPGQMACQALVVKRAHPDAASGPPSGAFGPADLQSAYALTAASAANGKGQTVAVVDAFNDPHAATDLAVYRTQFGLPACTVASGCLKIVNQAGGSALLRNDPTGGGWALEISLDLGEGAFNSAFNHPGVAIVAAAGDSGYGPQFPASAQNVTAVGGTSLHKASNTRGWTETAWSGTGSGCSSLQAAAGWLQATVPAACQNRTEVDVSAVADPFTPVAVFDTVPQDGTVPNWIEI